MEFIDQITFDEDGLPIASEEYMIVPQGKAVKFGVDGDVSLVNEKDIDSNGGFKPDFVMVKPCS